LQQADGGTLFLDEIGDMPLVLQTRLLRVLEERRVEPIGGEAQAIDVRVISASHRDLNERVASGEFRQDLFYRLNGLVIELPPLRERSDKLALLDFLLAEEARGQPVRLAEAAREALLGYAWPGNVRQLRNVLRTLCALCENGVISHADLPAEMRHARPALAALPVSKPDQLGDAERQALLAVLDAQHWHISHAAEQLGISRNTLYRKLRKHGIAKQG
jgi:transcriptional regulator of acetoin/glycerol metabolism